MITKHFNPQSDKKIRCTCCGKGDLTDATYYVLELVRNHFGVAVIISSGFRCEGYNKKVGGGKESRHLSGIAVDITVKGVPAQVVYEYLNSMFPNSLGLGLYIEANFVHVDTRMGKGRWNG